jgi:LuxR family maltose regulon positive regulatory protein
MTGSTEFPTVIRTKLHRPPITGDLVERRHLIQQLNRGLDRKLTLISAAAGFGKTTLVSSWVQDNPRPVAWLSLDTNDNDLLVFLNYLVAAINTIFPKACPQTQTLWQAIQLPPLDYIAATLVNELTDLPEDFILVLDDYQVVRDHSIHQFLTRLIEHLPSQMHLVIACRTDPPIPLARLRVQQHMTEVRASQLSFSQGEVQAYLEQVLEEKVSTETTALLQEKTEGWIAGLRMAVLSIRSTDDVAAFVNIFKGVHHNVMDFLMDEVLSRQSQSVQGFLLQTSLLDRFCMPLCETVTDYSLDESQEILAEMERQNLFLIPLDFERGWYRYHHLFQDLLRHRLQQQLGQQEVAALHRRAGAWYGGQGLITEALQHFLTAGAFTEAARLVEENRHDALNREDWAMLERWLNMLPRETIQGRPALLLARAWVLDFRLPEFHHCYRKRRHA